MKNLLAITMLLFLSANVAAQNATNFDMSSLQMNNEEQPLTLEECITFAIANNPNLQSIQLEEQANDYKIKEIKASGLPQVSGSGQWSHNYALAEQILPGEVFGQPGESVAVKFGVANTLTGNLEMNQLLFSKSYRTGLKAVKTSQSLVKLNTFKTKEDLVYNIAQIYLQLQITEKQKEILNANINRINLLINISQVQFEEGVIKKIDVDQLRVNKTNLMTELQNVEIGVAQQLNVLKFYMGMSPNSDIIIAEYIQEGDRYPVSEELILTANTNLQLLNKQMELNELDIENIQAGYYPTLSAFARYGWQGQTDKLFSDDDANKIQGSPTGVFGLSLNVPIFDGFQRKNQTQQKQIKERQLMLDQKHLKYSIEMEFANAKNALRQNKTLLDAQKGNMQLAEELYGVTKLSYQEGIAPLTELLNAEQSLKEAQSQYLTSLLQLNLAELDQMKASGQLAKLIQAANN